MSYLRYLIPFLVFAFFLVKSRRSPIYVISLPLVLAFSKAIFIDTQNSGLTFFTVSLQSSDVLLILQVLGWRYIALQRPDSESITKSVGYRIAIIVLLYYGFVMLYSVFSLDRFGPRTLLGFPRLFYLPVGFLIMFDTYRRFDQHEVVMWLRDLSVITILLSMLYIFNALNPGLIYGGASDDYFYSAFGIVRNYSAFPYWTLLAFIVLISDVQQSFGKWLGVGVLVLSSALYYSRAFLLLVLVVFACRLVIIALKERLAALMVRLLVAGALFAGVLLILIWWFPVQSDFVAQRFDALLTSPFTGSGNALVDRVPLYEMAWLAVDRTNIWLGVGALGNYAASVPGAWVAGSWDSDYFPVLVTTGMLGVAVYLLPQILGLVSAISLIIKRSGDGFVLSLVAGLYVLAGLAWSVTSKNYTLYPSISAFALSLIAIEAGSLWMQPEQVKLFSKRHVPILRGVNLNWFTKDDEYALLRRLALAVVAGYVIVYLTRQILRF